MEQRRGEHRPRVPRGDDGVGLTVGDGADRPDERRVRLRPHGLDGMVVHLDRALGDHEREAEGVEARRAEEHRLDPGGSRRCRACDDLLRRVVSTQGVDRDSDGHRLSEGYGAWIRIGSTSRPLYVLQVGHT